MGLCMNPTDSVSLHHPRSETEIRRILPKESECYPVKINECRIFFPMIYGRERHQTERLILSMVGLTLT